LCSAYENRFEKKGGNMETRISGRKTGFCCVMAGGLFIAFLLTGLWTPSLRAAEPYPARQITIVVPMVAGGQFDLGARILAEVMEKLMKQPVVVVNKPGAAGTVGGYSVVSAKPDGYTLGYFHNSAAAPEVYTYFYSAPYSSNDLIPICRVHVLLNVITVKADAPYSTLKEFVEYARKNPGLKYAHNGKASVVYVVMNQIAKAENLNLVDVPYEGDGAVLPALLGGHVPLGIPAYSVVKSQIQAKKLKLLATLSEKRSSLTPDVPSLVELGYKLPYMVSVALYAPKKTPDEIIKKLDDVVRKIVEDKDFQKKNLEMDMILAHSDSALYQQELGQFKENVSTFFKEQGLVKK
jgi:tripartite-type tricarboxylate transporter receptor subunit TctC